MSHINSFPPIAEPNARILILGSIPGKASLQAQQYYAHPRNQFWPIICALLAIDSNSSYQIRTQAISVAGVALWDVVHSCHRNTSLDADIQQHTIVANDFENFFSANPLITHIFFNGATAEQTFRKHVLPNIASSEFVYKRLPSTSPAHAAMSFEQKMSKWRELLSLIGAKV